MPLTTRTVQLTIEDGALPVFEAVPDGVPRGAVLVVQEAFGVNAHIEDVTERFAAAGYHAVAPHFFHRIGDPTFDYDGTMDEARAAMGTLTAEGIDADADATLTHLGDIGLHAGRTAIVGFCMGGHVALSTAARRPLGAAVTFYGGGIAAGRFGYPPLVEQAPHLRTPWLGLFGDEDASIPIDEVEALRAAAAQAAVATEIVRYPGAGHGFHCDARASYHEAAAKAAWARALGWIEQHVPA